MDTQQREQWELEHVKQASFATMHTLKPSTQIPEFVQYLLSIGIQPAQSLVHDIGCGKGRNALYFASKGFPVIGTDFSEKALSDARIRSKQSGYNIEYVVCDMTESWPFPNDHFTIMIDCNSTVFIADDGRQTAIAEAYRTLKAGGFYFFYGMAAHEQATTSGTYKQQGFIEKRYTEEQLLAEYKAFTPISLKQIKTQDMMDGKEVDNVMWIAVFQKQVSS